MGFIVNIVNKTYRTFPGNQNKLLNGVFNIQCDIAAETKLWDVVSEYQFYEE